jgi:hypothetical protein
MFNNVVLNIVIGLVFIYLLYSLLATIIMEFLASIFDFRSRMLLKAIKVMLEDRHIWAQQYNNWLMCFIIAPIERMLKSFFFSIYRVIQPFPKPTLAKAFYQHPNIKYLSESIWNNRPSYISASRFSETLVQILRREDYDGSVPEMQLVNKTLLASVPSITVDGKDVSIDNETLLQLRQIYYDAKGDSQRFRQSIENWFNEMSERTTGWYKKQMQIYLLILGFFVAWQFNVDTLAIYGVLAKNDTVSIALAELASKSPEKYDAVIDSINKVRQQLPREDRSNNEKTSTEYLVATYRSLEADAVNANLVMGLGKPYNDSIEKLENYILEAQAKKQDTLKYHNKKVAYKGKIRHLKYSDNQRGGVHTLSGWMITALAISLGSPFWFDLLGKFINIRNAGKKPQSDESVKAVKGNVPPNMRVG